MKFSVINRTSTETVSLTAFFKGGKLYENKFNNGIGELFSRVWTKSNLLSEKSEFYGAYFGTHLGSDAFEISLNTLSEHFELLLEYLEVMFKQPKLDKDVFDREKILLLNEITALKDMPSAVAMENFLALTYKNFPYGLSSAGDSDSVSNIDFDRMKTYFEDNFSTQNLSLTLTGKFSNPIIKKVERIFSSLTNQEIFYSGEGSEIKTSQKKTDIDKRIEQAKLFIGYEAPSADSSLYPVIKILADYLGGGMSSKYFDLIRKEKGFAYSVGAYYPSRCFKSRFIIHMGLDKCNIESAVDLIKEINENFYSEIKEEELNAVKKYILGKILSETQTNAKISWYNSFFMNLGFVENYFDSYIENLEKITIEDIKKANEIFNGNLTVYSMVPE